MSECKECFKEINDTIYKHNGDILCKFCFQRRPNIKSDGFCFNTSRDKLWEFNTQFNGKTYEIRTKGQWKRYMKEKGLHDDISDKPFSVKQEPYKPVSREVLVDCMMKEIKEKCLYDKFKFKRRFYGK